jgi:hypothetical protein
MDAIGNDWNTAPACVLSTVWGTASIRDLAVEVGAVPASPIRRVLTSRQAGCAAQSAARANLWICGQHKRVAHKPTATTAATDNLNILEISSVRTTPGSPQRQPSRRSAMGPTTSSAIYTRVLTAVHTQYKRDADGGLTLLIQNESPGNDKEANWLPAPQGAFRMFLRLYWPKDEALNGTWKNPPLQRVG